MTAPDVFLLRQLMAMLANSHLATGERKHMLQQLDHQSSNGQAPLAVHSCCGKQLTLMSFVAYVMEMVVQFSLVFTISSYLLS